MIREFGLLTPVVLAALACQAQTRLGLREAVDSALRSRASLKAEQERVFAAEGVRKQAALLPNPEFQFLNENLRPGQTYTRDVDTLAMISQPLDVLGKRKQRIALAGDSVARAQADYEMARWRVIERVKLAYWNARGLQEIRDVLRSAGGSFQKIVDYHAAQLNVGAIAEQDVLRVRLESERLSINADLAALDFARARGDLLREMGAKEFTGYVLTEPLDENIQVEPLGIEQVLARRVEIKAARAALEQARANAKLQDVSARPDLNVTYGYKRTQLPDTVTGVNTAIASIRITLPFTDKNQGNRMAAAAEVRRQEDLLAAAEAEVRADYYSALQEYEMRRTEFLTALQPLREHAATISQIASAAYAEGAVDLLRLLDAERARLDAELAWTRGLADYRQSIVKLEAAEGVNQ
ncbi:MAG: TolC family protein [Bryobacterales bacterium]|nr:TolC family protein [Bryobacterales bacterium]MBV9401422.1 TolC family protein [Bryobacterales bacterium]